MRTRPKRFSRHGYTGVRLIRDFLDGSLDVLESRDISLIIPCSIFYLSSNHTVHTPFRAPSHSTF